MASLHGAQLGFKPRRHERLISVRTVRTLIRQHTGLVHDVAAACTGGEQDDARERTRCRVLTYGDKGHEHTRVRGRPLIRISLVLHPMN
eukprot:m.114952 g.114952  ORF g.114952 m.114952 type:complete len:89 (-) comp21531_c0_seq1:134-400(-)